MIYITNEYGHYFVISDKAWAHFDRDYLLRAGCEIHSTKAEMYEAVCQSFSLTIDEVEGSEIFIKLNAGGTITESCSSGVVTDVEEDDDINDWLVAYTL